MEVSIITVQTKRGSSPGRADARLASMDGGNYREYREIDDLSATELRRGTFKTNRV